MGSQMTRSHGRPTNLSPPPRTEFQPTLKYKNYKPMKTVKTLKLIISCLFPEPIWDSRSRKTRTCLFSVPPKGKIIDVSRLKHGEIVFCRYTGKMFRVP